MANSKYTIDTSPSTFISDLANALTSKYSTDVTIYSQTTTYIVFSCAMISTKVIRIDYGNMMNYNVFYGDSWSNEQTITNLVYVLYPFYNPNNGYTSHDLILGDNFMLMQSICTNTNIYSTLVIFGKATNGDSMVFSTIGSGYADDTDGGFQWCCCRDITKNIPINFKTFDSSFYGANNTICKIPLIITKGFDGEVLYNADNTLLGINGISVSSIKGANNSRMLGSNYMVTSGGYGECPIYRLGTGLLVEW